MHLDLNRFYPIFLILAPIFISLAKAEDFREIGLRLHNKYRKDHSAPPLTLSPELNDSAQKYANYLAKSGTFDHSEGDYGENLYYKEGDISLNFGQAVQEAVDSWYEEINKYAYDNPGFSMDTGHFTQLIWKSTAKLGMGVAEGEDPFGEPRIIIVAQYTPAGNIIGNRKYFEENVVPERNSGFGFLEFFHF